jgi:hypothetical protein
MKKRLMQATVLAILARISHTASPESREKRKTILWGRNTINLDGGSLKIAA